MTSRGVTVLMLAWSGAWLLPARPAAGDYVLNVLATLGTPSDPYGLQGGLVPSAGVIIDSQGNLYGPAQYGGPSGAGAIFEVAAGSHALSTVASFDGNNGLDPRFGLIMDSQGNLYGTTDAGGSVGNGTIYEIAAGSNTVTTLVNFDGSNGDGPKNLIMDRNGNLYGTTDGGGTNDAGTVFIVAAGTHALTTLVSFDGTNQSLPEAGLVMNSQGNLYGTTVHGGPGSSGTVYEVNPSTGTLTTLVNFNGPNGSNPWGGLVMDSHGNLYGITTYGGAYGDGTVFRIDAVTHALTTLVNFNGTGNGMNPYGTLAIDSSGDLFGTTRDGGSLHGGTVFEIAAGTDLLTTLTSFASDGPGAYPVSTLALDAQGNIYGTSPGGEDQEGGTVWELSPAVATVPEPSSYLMLAVGFALIAGWRKTTSASRPAARGL